ncbi:Ubiquitin conjugation factor E4 B [Phytophthora pseudosyringae]|uniref:Ubiquitin conjugation factor E4 B n=1 Tax=Phytophthora pseudosyringae TaxID=221518 RepID=A0A8T1VGI2_9STRA|nr:Ubiquitin conjugation factor E4 B [Phytophthora pseudosyringae]
MFLCARDASARAADAAEGAHAPPPPPDDASSDPPRALPPFRLPQDASDPAAYLQLLDALTRLVARLLGVHTLSRALRFSAGETVAVDAAEWWREVQAQSIAHVQRREAAHGTRRDAAEPAGRRLWPLTPRTQEATPEQEPRALDAGLLTSSETFEELPEVLWKDHAADFFAQALYLVLGAMERATRRQQGRIEEDTVLGEALVGTLASVDAGVASAAAQLLQRWAPVSQKTAVDSAEKLSKLMGVAVVNALLQPRNVGTRHAFHEHALLQSLPLRAFLGAKQWRCSVCERVSQTTGSDAARATCVYRCAACNFNLCRECFTRIPNTTGSRAISPLDDTTKLTTDRFFALVVPRLKHKTGAVAVRQIAQELRRRVLELYPHNFQGAAEFAQLFHKLLTSDKSAAVALVMSPPARPVPSSGRPAVAWFPLFMRTWTMSLSTLFGPFLRASTMLEETYELDAAVRAANHGSAVADCLRAQWTSGYGELRETLQALMRTLLADDQDLVVVDATLCWLALALMTADPRRRLNYDAHERLDGFLVNVTTMLLAYTLPVLDKAQHDPRLIDASYHQSVEPVRVYASKDFPEVPLHYARSTQDARANESVAGAEDLEMKARDQNSVAEYSTRRIQKQQGDQEVEELPSTFYPRLSCHEGVVCDQCEFANLHGVRYKCAFCGDMDLCSDCFEIFRSHQAATDSASESESETILHSPDHVFLRIESPIPVFALKHFQPLPVECLTNGKQKGDSSNAIECMGEGFDVSSIHCADCGDTLGTSGQPDDVFYKCANCLSTRVVCAACLEREEKLSNGNPNDMHAPGHVYFVVTDPWRRHLSIPWDNVLRKLHFRRLLHPPALIPRRRFPRDTELFYITLKYLHFGPLATLSRWLSMMKEVQELQAFCACDEERFELESQRQRRSRRRQNGSQRQTLKQSVHYRASKARLEDIRVKCVKMELHLLASSNVAEWLVFYARACRWLLHGASTPPTDSGSESVPQDPFAEPLSQFSSMFSGFPEHFFFDLCDVVYLLGLERLEYRDLVSELKKTRHDADGNGEVDEVTEIVEPLLVMLTQIVVAPKFTKNPHLRVEALRSLTTLLTFVSKGQQVQHRPGHQRMESLFKCHRLLSQWLIPGLMQFHSDMDRYNASNNGLAFTSAVSSGDHMLWGFLPTRVSVTLLLRYLWQLPSQRQSLLHMLNTPDATETLQTSLSAEPSNGSTQQLTGLVSGLWSDIAKLFDEANNKITTLRQIHDLIEDSLDGSVVVLPFRRDMLDGYVAINAKQLRLTMRLLLEALELTSWFASIVSGESSFRSRSLSAPAAALRHVLLQPLVIEQAARTLSFLVGSLANAYEEQEWEFSLSLVDDGKLMLAQLIVLVVRYAGHSTVKSSGSSSSSICSPSSFWKIIRSGGDIMERRVGDLDTHVRWGLNALCTRIESESYLGSTSLDDDDDVEEVLAVAEEAGREIDEDEALAVLEKQAVSTTASVVDASAARKRLGKRFIATLAKDGRFDFRLFVGGCRFLRPHRKQDGSSDDDSDKEAEDVEEGYLYLDESWVQQFVRAMQEADEMIHVQEAMEACLGDIPDQYLDPLLSTLMTDPVRLPSGNILDRDVIARHLLASSQQGGSTGRDPFTREPLTMAMVEPCDALRSEIQVYLRTKMRHFRKTAREDVLATWGIGWDVLFDSSSETEADSEDGAEGGANATLPSASQ